MTDYMQLSDSEFADLVAQSWSVGPAPAAAALIDRLRELTGKLHDDTITDAEFAEWQRLSRARTAWQDKLYPPFGSREIYKDPELFLGCTVTMAGKEAIRWEGTTIVGVDAEGCLILEGGEQVTQIFAETPVRTPITERTGVVPRWEIACGRRLHRHLAVGIRVRHHGQQFPRAVLDGTGAIAAVAGPWPDGSWEYLIYHDARGDTCPAPSWWSSSMTVPINSVHD
jgi:hypothetical protein